MRREQILLSDLDLEILYFLKEERFVKNIVNKFNINYFSEKKHMDRLRKLNSFDERRFGTFRKMIINKKGENILKILKWKM